MMELFRTWLLGIIGSVLTLGVIYALIPAGKLRSAARFTGGLILLLAVIGPLARFDPGWDFAYDEYAGEIQRQIDIYQEENLNQTRSIIAEQTGAYISDKGNEMGVTCHPVVTTRLDDGVPYPDSVTMDIPLHRELADCIARDLGIPLERQYWQER